jgi:F-type H+-transporting ATPase subunit a
MVEDTMGKHNAHWTPYIATLFCTSILGSYLGMTGILRSSTADLSTTLTWALMTSVLCWAGNIKNNGFWGWLKGFAEPMVVMTPMNLVSEIAQPISMAFRHFGNIAGGGVLTSLIYAALSAASSLIIRKVASTWIIVALVALLGAFLLWKGIQKKKLMRKIFGIAFLVISLFALLDYLGLLSGVPVLQVGIPAMLSLYFDVFSGLVQALVFSLLTMVYVGNACPPPEEKED